MLTEISARTDLQPIITLVETLEGLHRNCRHLRQHVIERETLLTGSLVRNSLEQQLAIIQAAPSVVHIVALALNKALEARGYCLTLSAVRPETIAASTAKNSPEDVVLALRGFVASGDLQLLPEAELRPLITLVETVNGLKEDCEQLRDRLIERATPLTCSLAQKLAILQAAPSVFEIIALALNNALEARGYCLTVSAITPQHSADDVVHALRGFVAQNNLILNIQYTVHRCFNAEIATTDNMFDVVDLLQPENCFVVSVYGKSSNCDASNVDAKREAEYDLACQISGRQLLVSSVPRIELRVPDLLMCAIDKSEIAA